MKCPMSFANRDERGAWSDCDQECAWLVTQYGRHFCAVAVLTVATLGVNEATIHGFETKEAKNDAVS